MTAERAPAGDLVALTAWLVDQPSESRHEQGLTDALEAELDAVPWLTVERVGDNVVARTELGRPARLVLAGHTDTVPANGNAHARIAQDRVIGLGAADMKGGLAVMLDLARSIESPAVDVSYVFYAREEVDAAESGLLEMFEARPDLVAGDAALLGEPTGGALEAGCQGTVRLRLTLAGARAHTARPWTGRNAIHRLGTALALVAAMPERRPVLDGCEYREALQAVFVDGGVAANVVPDRASLVLNHRFAPDRTIDEAVASVRSLLAPTLEADDEFVIEDAAAGAAPGLDHPLLSALIEGSGLEVRAKLGWTDVARFAAQGIPAANFGPGDPLLAHTADEWVSRAALDAARHALADLITRGA